MKKVCIYVRVSTTKQTVENQINVLRYTCHKILDRTFCSYFSRQTMRSHANIPSITLPFCWAPTNRSEVPSQKA